MDDTSNTSRLLMFLNSRLTESRVTDTFEERIYRGFGLKLRYRRNLAASEAVAAATAVGVDDAAGAALPAAVAEDAPTPVPEEASQAEAPGSVQTGEVEVSPAPQELAADAGEPELPPAQMGLVAPGGLEAPPPPGQHPILSGQTVAVVGFSPEESAALGQALAAQYCSFLFLTHTDAEFRKGSTNGCDLVLVSAPADWVAVGSLHPASVLNTSKPIAIFGERNVLSKLAIRRQGGLCELLPAPWTVDDAIWRAANLLARVQAPKKRNGRKHQHKRVVIGDESAARALVHAVLAQEGLECSIADNGVDALALARNKRADAVIIDVGLPGLDGFQVLAEIRRDPLLKDAVVILLTASQAEADVLRGFGLGADDYVSKPFSPMELAARVKRFLVRRP